MFGGVDGCGRNQILSQARARKYLYIHMLRLYFDITLYLRMSELEFVLSFRCHRGIKGLISHSSPTPTELSWHSVMLLVLYMVIVAREYDAIICSS